VLNMFIPLSQQVPSRPAASARKGDILSKASFDSSRHLQFCIDRGMKKV
jgi:hypothetical protein